MTLRSHRGPVLADRRSAGSAARADRLSGMRVRRFELRLIAIALVVAWSVAAGLVLLAYRPGGPFDLVVGLTAMIPIAIALAGAIWPPVARGEHAFPVIVWLGIGALLCLVPSIAGVVTQLLAYGSRTLLPSRGGGLPVAAGASGDEPVQRDSASPAGCPAATVPRGPRLAGGVAIAVFVTTLCDDRLLGRRGRQRPGPARRRRERVTVRPDRRRARTAVVRRAAHRRRLGPSRAAPVGGGRPSPGWIGRPERDAGRQGLPLAGLRRDEPPARAVRRSAGR